MRLPIVSCSLAIATGLLAGSPAWAEPPAPRHELTMRTGYRWGLPANAPIVGVTYRRILSDWLSVRGGLEFAGVEAVTAGNPSNLMPPAGPPNSNPPVPTPIALTGVSLALLTNGSPYVWLGATVSQAFYNFSQTPAGAPNQIEYRPALEGIVGLRYAVRPFVVGAEYRLGHDLAGTLAFYGGGLF